MLYAFPTMSSTISTIHEVAASVIVLTLSARRGKVNQARALYVRHAGRGRRAHVLPPRGLITAGSVLISTPFKCTGLLGGVEEDTVDVSVTRHHDTVCPRRSACCDNPQFGFGLVRPEPCICWGAGLVHAL